MEVCAPYLKHSLTKFSDCIFKTLANTLPKIYSCVYHLPKMIDSCVYPLNLIY